MEYLELPALPPLHQIVRCFWFLRSGEITGVPQPVVADGRFEIVLHAGEPFSRVNAEGRLAPQDDALLAGQLSAPLYLLQRGAADVVGIRFRTAAAQSFLRLTLGSLTNQVESLRQIDGRLRDSLLLALSRSPDPFRRRAALGEVLLRSVRGEPDSLAMTAVRSLDHSAPPTVASLATSLGTSVRTLERRVATATGLAPRQLLRTLRFRRVFQGLQSATSGNMTRAALAAGYFDQAHCIREFRRYAGASPAEFFGQDSALASALVASVQSPERN